MATATFQQKYDKMIAKALEAIRHQLDRNKGEIRIKNPETVSIFYGKVYRVYIEDDMMKAAAKGFSIKHVFVSKLRGDDIMKVADGVRNPNKRA